MSPASDQARRVERVLLGSFAFLAVFFSGVFPPFSNPNELSRFQTVVAAVEHGTFAIDPVIPVLGDHEDKATSGGRTFSNKAPGLSFAAIPVYRLLRIVMPPPTSANADPIFVALRVLTVSLVCLIALARFSRRVTAANPAAGPLVLCAVALGTPYLFYARSFFGHAWSAALLFLSWDLLRAAEEREPARTRPWLPMVAGFLAGWAAISEYTVGPVAILLAIRAASGRSWPKLGGFAAGLTLPLALLGIYNSLCFGSPWILSSAREAYPGYSELAQTGFFGFGAPSATVAIAYLGHPARGVLLFSPFLLWAVPGFFRWWRRREQRADFWLALAATVLFPLMMTGYPNWHGGWALGSRYLLPVLFFPCLAIAYSLQTPLSRSLFTAAAVFSAASHLLLTSTFPYFPDNVPWPVATGSAWFLARGWVAPNLLDGFGWGGAVALLAAAAAFVLPLALAIKASGALVPRSWIAILLGLAPLALLLSRPPELSFPGRLWRAAIFGSYSGLDPQRTELAAVVRSASTPKERRQAINAWREAGPR